MTNEEWIAQLHEATRRQQHFDRRYELFWNSIGLLVAVVGLGFGIVIGLGLLIQAVIS